MIYGGKPQQDEAQEQACVRGYEPRMQESGLTLQCCGELRDRNRDQAS